MFNTSSNFLLCYLLFIWYYLKWKKHAQWHYSMSVSNCVFCEKWQIIKIVIMNESINEFIYWYKVHVKIKIYYLGHVISIIFKICFIFCCTNGYFTEEHFKKNIIFVFKSLFIFLWLFYFRRNLLWNKYFSFKSKIVIL